MGFKTDAQRTTYDKTRRYLLAIFGEVNVRALGDMFILEEGSALIYVRVFPIGEKRAAVEVFSYVVIDLDVTEELMRYLLTYNLKLVLGAFGLAIGPDGKGSLLLTHKLLGDTMEREELYASVAAIARVADEMDDRIVAAYGGVTAIGKLSPAPPPERWE